VEPKRGSFRTSKYYLGMTRGSTIPPGTQNALENDDSKGRSQSYSGMNVDNPEGERLARPKKYRTRAR